jgi:LacI family transcriptional regulator
MKKTPRVTQKLIAERTGLSIATVDRAINNRGNVKPQTLQKVLEASKELEYTVNQSASLLSRKEDISIAVILLVYPEFFWNKIEESVWKAHQELSDFGLNVEIFHMSDNDLEGNLTTVKEIINLGRFNALALPAWHDAFIEVIDEATDQGFPVCTFNLDAPMSKRLFYVGCDYNVAGKLAAELLCKLIKEEGDVVLFTDSFTSLQSQQKIAGFRAGLASFPNVKLKNLIKIDRDVPQEQLNKLEHELKEKDGIYVSNAELVSIAELKQKINPGMVVVGHDINTTIYNQLKSGGITAIIGQDPASQGYLTVKTLFDYLVLKKEIDKREQITKLEVVLKENAKYHM